MARLAFNFRCQWMDLRLWLSAWLLLGLGFASGCRREERNFRSGGPSSGPAKWERDAQSPEHFTSATGPHTDMERNAFALSEGKRLYSAFNCIGCHANGGGDIGPALMDRKWLYGATPEDVYSSILDGRPNGMPAFRGRITEVQARQLTAYVRSLSGQARAAAATSRDDHLKTGNGENSIERGTPQPHQPRP